MSAELFLILLNVGRLTSIGGIAMSAELFLIYKMLKDGQV